MCEVGEGNNGGMAKRKWEWTSDLPKTPSSHTGGRGGGESRVTCPALAVGWHPPLGHLPKEP